MLRNEKFLLTLSICLTLLFIFPEKAFANVDFSLEDNTETNEISIVVNSNNEYIDGLDMSIVMSEDVTIQEDSLPETIEMCTLGGRVYTLDNKLYIECFNESGSVMEGTLLTVSYTAETSDYYFYIDTNSIDLGLKELGTITNINYSEEAPEDNDSENEAIEDKSFQDNIISFISENLFYIAGGVILIIIILVVLMGKTPKEKIPTQEEKIETEAKDINEQQN